MPFETPKNFQPYTASEEETKHLRPLTMGEADELGIGKKKREKKSLPENFDPLLAASFQNPETGKEREISFDIGKEIDFFEELYRKNLGLSLDKTEIISIWGQNYQEMKKEIGIYGYDALLIIPANLPEEEVFNRSVIDAMEENIGGVQTKVSGTYQSADFKAGGSFGGVRNSEIPHYRIILAHSDQNIRNNPAANPFLKATLGKNIMTASGIDAAELQRRIAGNHDILVDFEATIGKQKTRIRAEGLSLKEYEIFQRVFFEKNGKHLDEDGWTWLIKSFSGSRVVYSRWSPGDRQFSVFADDPGFARGSLGLRLSRSFKKLP